MHDSGCLRAGVADICVPDPLGSAAAGLATQRLRAQAELDTARDDWAAAAARLQEAVEASDAPHWAHGLRGWALVQVGDLEVSNLAV